MLKSMLELAPIQSQEQVPNLLQIGARCVHIVAQLAQHPTVVVFAADRKEVEVYLQYLRALDIEDVVYYPTPSLSPYEWTGEERLSCHQRHAVRHRLLDTDTPPRCLLMTYQAPTHLMMDNLTWYQSTITLYPGDRIAPPQLVQRLVQTGYEPVNWISAHGQFTRRGAVLDVYPVGLDRVVRLEWFDDEIEKIWSYRLNDTVKPREEKRAMILPAFEWVIPTDLAQLKTRLQEKQRGNFIPLIKEFQYRPDLYQIMALLHPVTSLLGCLPERSLLLWPEGLWHKTKAFAHLLDESAQQRQLDPQHLTLAQIKNEVSRFAQQQLTGHDGKTQGAVLPAIEQSLDRLAASLSQWLAQGYRISVVSPQPQRVLGILQERDCPAGTSPEPVSGQVQVLQGNLPGGFAYAPLKWICFTDRELFQRESRLVQRKKFKRPVSPLRLSQLRDNMLVVHDVHGIGRYQGLVQYSTTGETREYLSVQYAGSDRLLVPVEQMHRLQIYQGVGGEQLKLHKLGGAEWDKAKAKVKKNLVEIAEQLLRTEATRMQADGTAFPPDSEWQREMEFAFPYEETPDQLQAIQETKADMEQPAPMNRLVCGDVGFGKTEVALRATFKAAIAGHQVALLAPTTILAHQHYQLLKDRFAPYPIRVELLSRYRSQKESDQLFADLKAGAVDIVVATHRLLSKKLAFHKLGLLIIDEEHRFGVSQKEKLKQLAPGIDILTMSATPIPRTLNIALGGLKALSLIETPPPNRHAIQTHVEPYNEETIKKAIYHELQRGGQIYYVHNRVKSIYEVGNRIK
ncbi:MAG: DEAD/DEAH box helicase, partial [Candidatus Sericytochromatia bacterium]